MRVQLHTPTCIDRTSIRAVVDLGFLSVPVSNDLTLPLVIVTAFILAAAVVVLRLLPQNLVIQSRHDNGSTANDVLSDPYI